MARKYYNRRGRKPNAVNELLFIGGASFLLVIAAAASSGGLSSGGLLVIILVIGIIAAIVLGTMTYIGLRRQRALRLLDLAAIDSMPGLQFEKWVGGQLQARGHHVRYTPINDYGVDIVAKKDGIRTAVQVKRYRNILDQKPVREAVAGMMHYKCSRSMVVTNSHFTEAAKVLAKSNRCELIDREKLAAWLAEQQQN